MKTIPTFASFQMQIRRTYNSGFVAAVLILCGARIANSQLRAPGRFPTDQASLSICGDETSDPAARAALRLVCQQQQVVHEPPSPAPSIVIGFLGGFTKANNAKRPEVLFATYLREHYAPDVHAEVFSNRNEKGALNYVLRLLDTNFDGSVSDQEKKRAKIIIYGHSWGASETAAFARELGQRSIPVLLTIQLDIISKYGQEPVEISPNVESAVNFYQPRGPLHGRTTIIASDPARTKILGNFRMTYGRRSVNCANYPWFVRTFNKPHHEIENDANVWDQVALLIDSEMLGASSKTAPGIATKKKRVSPSSASGDGH
jgi:hypothetical protein